MKSPWGLLQTEQAQLPQPAFLEANTTQPHVTSPPRRSHRAISRGPAAARPPLRPSRAPARPLAGAARPSRAPSPSPASPFDPSRPRAPQRPPALPPAPPRAAAASRHLSCSRRSHRASPRPFRDRSLGLRACARRPPPAGVAALRSSRSALGGKWRARAGGQARAAPGLGVAAFCSIADLSRTGSWVNAPGGAASPAAWWRWPGLASEENKAPSPLASQSVS